MFICTLLMYTVLFPGDMQCILLMLICIVLCLCVFFGVHRTLLKYALLFANV